MLDHDTILAYLSDAFGERYAGDRGISLVARYHDPNLALARGRAQLFIPDCHLLSHRDAPAYPRWGFTQDDDLLLCLEALTALKADHPRQIRVWQLGDLFDIWRARGGEGAAAELDKITADQAHLVDLLRFGAPFGVKAELIAGNHDYALYQLAEWRAARFRIIENEDPAGGDILVLHGDLFEWIERLPDGLQAAVVRFARWHASGGHELYNDAATVALANRSVPTDDSPLGIGEALLCPESASREVAERLNVIPGAAQPQKSDNEKFYLAARELAVAMRVRGYNIRVVVLGHTHFARIVAGNHDDGAPFVLVDAGAWIGRCRLTPRGPWVENAQIAVIVGDDVRIYQLGRRER